MRVLMVALVMLSVSLVPALAQTSSVEAPSLVVTTRLGDGQTPHQVNVDGAKPNSAQSIVVFDPSGSQTRLGAQTSSGGHASWTLTPPNGGWQLGLYRVVLALANARSVSATFVAGDGKPHIFADPSLPSPTSAFNFVGIGFKMNSTVSLNLLMAGAQGQRTIQVGADEAGSFSVFVWPRELAVPFFSAGEYILEAPALGLTSNFEVREHPVSAALSVQGPVVAGESAGVSLRNYPAGRLVWAVYADMSGTVAGELLLGPVDSHGVVEASAQFTLSSAGPYFLASPYDWGETMFDVLEPTATATLVPPTASSTPTNTTTPTATPAPTETATSTATARPTPRARPSATARPRAMAKPTARPKRAVVQKKPRCSTTGHGKKRKRVCRRPH